MAEFLAGYSGLLDAISFVFVVVSLAGFALTASFSKASLTIVVDLAYPVGLLGSLLGWIIMLTNQSDPKAIGARNSYFFPHSSLCGCDTWPRFRPIS